MEGVRQRTCRDAHPPRENLSFQEKCWKGVPKSIKNRSWGSLGAPKSSREGPGALLGGFGAKWVCALPAPSLFGGGFGRQKGGQEGPTGRPGGPKRGPKGAWESPREVREPPKSAFLAVFSTTLFFDRFLIHFAVFSGPFLGGKMGGKSGNK